MVSRLRRGLQSNAGETNLCVHTVNQQMSRPELSITCPIDVGRAESGSAYVLER